MDFVVSLDQYVLEFLYAMRDPVLAQVFIWISELGRVQTVLSLAAIAVLIFAIRRQYAYAAGTLISVAISGLGVLIGKGLVERARPDELYQAYVETWYSFPSAHAALSAALYGFLIYATGRIRSPALRFLARSAGTIVIGAVAFRRLYLGVHFLSDVVAGLILGIASVWLAVLFVRMIQK